MVEYVDIAARTAVGLVFAASVFGKVRGRTAVRAFTAGLRATRVVPAPSAPAVAVTVVGTEITVAVLLARAGTAPVGFAAAAVLLTAFTTAIVVVLRRGIVASCPCFGTSSAAFGRRHVVRNVGLLAVVGAGAWAGRAGGPVEPAGVGLAVAVGLLVAVLVVVFEDLAALFGTPTPVRSR